MNTDICSNSNLKKGKVFHAHAIKLYSGSWWRLCPSHFRKDLQYPTNRKQVGPQSQSGYPAPTRILTLDHSACSLVSMLSYNGFVFLKYDKMNN